MEWIAIPLLILVAIALTVGLKWFLYNVVIGYSIRRGLFHIHDWEVVAEYKTPQYHDIKKKCSKCGAVTYEHWFILGPAEVNKEALDKLEKKAKK